MTEAIRIATRRSALALWQANHVRDRLLALHPGLEVELVPIVTRGDRIIDRPLAEIGGKGLFLKELEKALLDGDADIAVHSMKDVPVALEPGLDLPVVLERASPFDALVSREDVPLDALPSGARVGTSSLRRQCQLRAARPDLEVLDLRGNVDTRLAKLDAGEYDAIILACAGLERLGLGARISEVLAPPRWLPAATQGIIGIETRAGDAAVVERIAPLADATAQRQAAAERIVSRRLEGSCQVPLAAYAAIDGDRLEMRAMVGTPDGRTMKLAGGSGPAEEATRIATEVAESLVRQGAMALIAALERP